MRLVGILLSLSVAWGGEFAVFNNGSRLHIDRHETVNATTLRLYQGEGFTELGVCQIAAFEPDDAVPTPGQPVAQTALPVERQSTALSSTELTPEQLADRAADKYGLPHQLVRSVMAAESANQVKVVSPKGAIGLMQLMPATAQDLGVNPHDPAQNVDAGTRYLRDLLVKYRGALWHALAAYNAGPGAVDKHNSIPPYRETIRYINRIDRALRLSGALNSAVDGQ
jgi:transglycosylase-like protein with SLT domain